MSAGDLQRNLTDELAEASSLFTERRNRLKLRESMRSDAVACISLQARERVSRVKRSFRQKLQVLQRDHEAWREVIESHQKNVEASS